MPEGLRPRCRVDRLFLTVLAVPLDFAVIVSAGLLTWELRFSTPIQQIRPVAFSISFSHYFALVLLAALFTVAAIAVVGLYRFPKTEIGAIRVTLRLFLATSTTLAAIAFTFFFRQELFNSRFLVIVDWILATALLIVERGFVALLEHWLARRFGIGLRRAVLIGEDAVSKRLIVETKEDPSVGFRIVSHLAEPNLDALKAAVSQFRAEAVILADPNYERERILEMIDFTHEHHLNFLFVPNLFQTLTTNARPGLIGDVPVIELKRTALEGWGRAFKRAVDVVGACVAIIIFSPLLLAIAIAVKMDDPTGPVIYRNRRVGEYGRPFFTYKFRSMLWKYSTGPGAPDPEGAMRFERELATKQSVRQGPVWKILDDPRRTRLGRMLERTSLDELPQFFNVLMGEMSLVGPRPHMLEQVAQYAKEHKRVLSIKPGITGLAQISGRSDLNFDDEVRLDTHYLEHWSLWADMKILFQTPLVILFHRHRS